MIIQIQFEYEADTTYIICSTKFESVIMLGFFTGVFFLNYYKPTPGPHTHFNKPHGTKTE